MSRAASSRRRRIAAVVLCVLLGTAVAALVLERRGTGAWSGVGEDGVRFSAVLATGQGLTPGQGQDVTIAGVEVGAVTDVAVQGGLARVRFRLRPRYAAMVRRDASALARPRTGQGEPVLELDPGTPSGPRAPAGFAIAEASGVPGVDPDEILAALDVDTRAAVRLLLRSAGTGVGSRRAAQELARVLRTGAPLARRLRRVGEALDARSENVARAVGSLRSVADALAAGRADVVRTVEATADAAGTAARRSGELRAALRELPATLRATRAALGDAEGAAGALPATTAALRPVARALAPAARSARPFLRGTTPVLVDRLGPLAAEALPVTRGLRDAAVAANAVAPDATATLRGLNAGANLLAHDPPGEEQGYLFWAQWLAHLTPWILNTQDANGPIRRSQLLLTCDTLEDLAGLATVNPTAAALGGPFASLARTGGCPEAPGRATRPHGGGGGGR